MNARCFLLPAILVALFAVSWSPADELPKAPPPHVKKTTAELLVGKWNRVKFLDKPLRPGSAVLNEFTQDGKFIFVVTDPKTGREMNTGVYRVVGNTIRLTSDPAPDSPSESWDVTIESISEIELALAARPPNEIQRSTYKRMKKQK